MVLVLLIMAKRCKLLFSMRAGDSESESSAPLPWHPPLASAGYDEARSTWHMAHGSGSQVTIVAHGKEMKGEPCANRSGRINSIGEGILYSEHAQRNNKDQHRTELNGYKSP
jgi:hypothetical protein